MKIYKKEGAITKINNLTSTSTPFLILTDFEGNRSIIKRLDKVNVSDIKYKFGEVSNFNFSTNNNRFNGIEKKCIDFELYQKAFDVVISNIKEGNSFLTNLTCASRIKTNLSLEEIFIISNAKFKIWVKGFEHFNEFVCFSPEIFVKINTEGIISSFPMKGTIDTKIENAESVILEDEKEFFEHTTIVDLIRNDISKIAEKVWVEKFRYIDKIKTLDGELLQVSSQVCGKLDPFWKNKFGDILFSMLPAGSISGAPKGKTVEIIKKAEKYTYNGLNRNFYTGICGIFDGETFNSGVMIRFIENTPQGLLYKSGGGITAKSMVEKEYQEMIQKIYVPTI
ncbi:MULTISPECIES: aminodeoxychorismate synthase component I [Emticicia]|uniref:aminodeoxychorismate synthase component I n=1 Tax=Emticicia TaxID=312278 RepID=UPI0007D8C0F2|nr:MULTISPECIES: aminodeoxychorismate synthase component I [Emticicia]